MASSQLLLAHDKLAEIQLAEDYKLTCVLDTLVTEIRSDLANTNESNGCLTRSIIMHKQMAS